MRKTPILVSALFASASTLAQVAPVPQPVDDPVLFHRPTDGHIVDSRYGPVASFQRALLAAAQSCGIPVANLARFADGRFGASSSRLLKQVAACRHLAMGDADGDTVTESTWRALATDRPTQTRASARGL